MRALAFVVCTGLFAVGCSAGEANAASAGEDEVVTARCPARFDLEFKGATLFWDTIERSNSFTANQKSNLLTDMREAKDRGEFRASFTLEAGSKAVCRYDASGVPGVEAAHVGVRFETKGGRDQLRIDAGGIHYYVGVASYDANGLELVEQPADVYGSFPIEETTDQVRVGTVAVTTAGSGS